MYEDTRKLIYEENLNIKAKLDNYEKTQQPFDNLQSHVPNEF